MGNGKVEREKRGVGKRGEKRIERGRGRKEKEGGGR